MLDLPEFPGIFWNRTCGTMGGWLTENGPGAEENRGERREGEAARPCDTASRPGVGYPPQAPAPSPVPRVWAAGQLPPTAPGPAARGASGPAAPARPPRRRGAA